MVFLCENLERNAFRLTRETNTPFRLGRFDRQIEVTLPTAAERVEIFNVYLKKLKLEKEAETYSQYLSEYTSGFSGADISNFCNEAALHAGSHNHEFISDENFWHAVERLKFGLKKRSGGSVQPDQKRKFAYHEAGHAIVAWMLEHTDPLLRVRRQFFDRRDFVFLFGAGQSVQMGAWLMESGFCNRQLGIAIFYVAADAYYLAISLKRIAKRKNRSLSCLEDMANCYILYVTFKISRYQKMKYFVFTVK